MGRYLVIWKGMPSTLDKLEEGSRMWQETMKEFPDIHGLYTFGNLAEGHVFAVFEAPSADRLRELNRRGEEIMRESGKPAPEGDFERGFDIIPLEFEFDGENLVYRRELIRAH